MKSRCFRSLGGLLLLGWLCLTSLSWSQTPPTPPLLEKTVVPSVNQTVEGAQRLDPGNPNPDAIIDALDSELIGFLDDLTLNRTDEHFGDGFYRLADATGRFLIPNDAAILSVLLFNADVDGQLVDAILGGDAVGAANIVTAYATYMAAAAPQTATEWGTNAPNFAQDMVQRIAKILYNQVVFVPELKKYVKDTAVGPAPTASRLVLHLVAEDIQGAADGAAVTRWPDRSGNNHNVVAPGGQEPTYVSSGLNGKPALRFDKTRNQCLDVDLPAQINDPSYTFFAVFKSNNPGDGSVDTVIGALNQPGDLMFRLLFVHKEGTWTHPRVRSQPLPVVDLIGKTEVPIGEWSLATLTFDSPNSLSMLHMSGEPDGGVQWHAENAVGLDNPVNIGDLPFTGRIRIGALKTNGEGLNGEIAEIRVYEGALTPPERDRIVEQMSDRYNFGVEKKKVVLSDNFNIANTNLINTQLNVRQTGLLAPIPYAGNAQAREVRNREALFSLTQTFRNDSWAQASPEIDFKLMEQEESFRIRVSVSQNTGPSPIPNYPVIVTSAAGQQPVDPPLLFEGSWAGIRFRSTRPNNFMADGGDGIGLLLYPAGGLVIFNRNQVIYTGTIQAARTHHLDIVVQNNQLTVFVNGALPIPPTPASPNFPLEIPPSSGNFVTLQGYGTHNKATVSCAFDNFDFSVIPQSVERETFTILEDTFDAPDGTGINAQLASRQSGERATRNYQVEFRGEGSKADIRGNSLQLLPNNDLDAAQVLVSPDLDLLSVEGPKGFRIQFNVDPGKGAGDRWSGIKFRSSQALASVNQGDGFGMLIRGNGALEFFDGEFPVASRNVPEAASYQFDLLVQSNILSGTINGDPILFGNSLGYQVVVGSAHYVTLSTFAGAGAAKVPARFDHLIISSLEELPPEVSLSIESLPNRRVRVSWPELASPGVLEYRDEFSDFSLWQDFFATPQLVEGRYEIIDSIEPDQPQKFYRLRLR